MAEAAVNFILEKFRDVALSNAFELYHIREQFDPIQQELRLIQCLLRHADSKRKRDPLIKQWINEVRDVAYRIEDVMDTFLVEIDENQPKSSGIMSKLKSLVKIPTKLEYSSEIKNIRESLKLVYERRIHLGLKDVGCDIEENYWLPFRPSKLCDIDVSEVVGLDSDKRQIIRHLLDRTIQRRTILSIVGIGGLGKTTLAQKVYKRLDEHRFKYIWNFTLFSTYGCLFQKHKYSKTSIAEFELTFWFWTSM
jgi:ATP-dependent Lon protease